MTVAGGSNRHCELVHLDTAHWQPEPRLAPLDTACRSGGLLINYLMGAARAATARASRSELLACLVRRSVRGAPSVEKIGRIIA